MKLIDFNMVWFFGKVVIDFGFGGMVDEVEEGWCIVEIFGDKLVLIMGNYGVFIVVENIVEVFEYFYFFECVVEILLKVYVIG